MISAFPRRFETLWSGSMDVLLAFPPLILVLAIIAFFGQSIFNLTAFSACSAFPPSAVARATTLTLSRRES